MKGLGRGKGFKITNKQRVDFSSPVVRIINDRLLNLVSMMMSEGVISQEDIVENLQLDEYMSNDDYTSLSDELDDANEQLDEANSTIDSYQLRFGRMSRLISDALNEDYENLYVDEDDDEDDEDLDDEESKSISFLEFGLDRFIENYQASRDSDEDNGRNSRHQ